MKQAASMKIRNARLTDAEAIHRVHRRAIDAVGRSYYSESQIAAWGRRANPRDTRDYEEIVSDTEVFVAEIDGAVVGFSQFVPESREVRAVYVDPNVGGRGIGSALLKRVEVAARDLDLGEIELRASLNAMSFYSARGWEMITETTHRLADGTELPCVLMRKRL